MRKDTKKEAEKKLLKLERDYLRLLDSRRGAGGHWIKVDKPYQVGWFQSFKLREDAANRGDAAHMRQALALVNNSIHSHRKDFKKRDFKTGKWVDIPHYPRVLTEKQYEPLTEKLKSLFVFGTIWPATHGGFISRGYGLRVPYYYVKHVYPAIVTERWEPDPEFQSKLAELSNKLQRDKLWPKLSRLHGRSTGWGRNEFNQRKFKFLLDADKAAFEHELSDPVDEDLLHHLFED